MSECVKICYFKQKKYKRFSGTAPSPNSSPVEKETPPTHAPPPRRLDSARAYGARTPLVAPLRICHILQSVQKERWFGLLDEEAKFHLLVLPAMKAYSTERGYENAGPENDGLYKPNVSQYVHWVVTAYK